MVNLKILEKRGVSAEDWEKIWTLPEHHLPLVNPWNQFNTDTKERVHSLILPDSYNQDTGELELEDGANQLRNRIRMRIMEGREFNFASYQNYKALDDALDVPLKKALTPTLLSRLADKTGTRESLEKELKAWGFDMGEVIMEAVDSKVPGKDIRRISAPSFFQIFVPLVKAYLTIRRAKIMNDLTQTPFFKYEPAWESARSRLQCEALTSRVEVTSEQMGYWKAVDEAVFHTLHYGKCFQFPMEEWYSEEQEVEDEKLATKLDGKPMKTNGRLTRVVKEGLRYHCPHLSRTFWDQAHAAHTFNTGTGCSYGGYWRVFRYRDVLANQGYYNRDRIFIGNYGWYSQNSVYFQSVYPCVMQYPWPPASPSNDRETKLVEFVYTKDMGDKPIVLTEYFEKFIPKMYGLGDYDHPIWARFVVAGDDTIIYSAPLPYDPVTYWHYDEDPARLENPSMTMEILPWQDHLGQLLTQYVLTIKQNLANVTFVDEDMVDKRFIDQIKNLGEKLFRTRNFIPFSGKKFMARQNAVPNAFFSHNFPQMDSNGCIQAIKLVLDLVERVLQMSSQEVGAAASHEQTKAEVVNISSQTSTRLTYTTTPIHIGCHAMMKQNYYGHMAFGSEEFWAQIPFDQSLTPEALKKLGFTWDEEAHPRGARDKRIVVRVHRDALMIESFAMFREGDEKRDQPELALAMFQFLDRVLKGPLGPAIGTQQAIDMFNLALKVGGYPKDAKLHNASPALSPEQQAEQIKAQLSGFIQEIEQKIMGEVQAGMLPIMKHDKDQDKILADQSAALEHLSQILEHSQAHQPPQLLGPGGMPMVAGMPNGAPAVGMMGM